MNPYFGALHVGNGLYPAHLWYEIHNNATSWFLSFQQNENINVLNDVTEFDVKLTKNLSDLPAERWSALCSAAGWTVYGAVALSWCEGAKLEDVWSGWLASGFPLKPLPEFERPARFINPALLTDKTTVEGINQWSIDQQYPNQETYALAVCATIAALKTPLEFGLSPEQYAVATPQIAAFLKSRLLQKFTLTPQETDLIATFDQNIKGTEWDVWAKEAA